jgi:hypothetical protein
MGVKQLALFAAAALTVSAPSQAEDFLNPNPQFTSPGSMLFVSIPLGGSTAKDRVPSYGFAFQGRRQYERVMVDNRFVNAAFEGGLIAGIEAKWIIVGAVVVGAGAYALRKDDSRSETYQGSQNNQQNNNTPASPPPPACNNTDPCKK